MINKNTNTGNANNTTPNAIYAALYSCDLKPLTKIENPKKAKNANKIPPTTFLVVLYSESCKCIGCANHCSAIRFISCGLFIKDLF